MSRATDPLGFFFAIGFGAALAGMSATGAALVGTASDDEDAELAAAGAGAGSASGGGGFATASCGGAFHRHFASSLRDTWLLHC